MGAGVRHSGRQRGIEDVDRPAERRHRLVDEPGVGVADAWLDRGQRGLEPAVLAFVHLDRNHAAIRRQGEAAWSLAFGQCHARRDRRVAAERDLGGRTEVADPVRAGRARRVGHQEGRLRVTDVRRDLQHLGRVRVKGAQPDAGRVATGRVGREGGETQQLGGRSDLLGHVDIGRGLSSRIMRKFGSRAQRSSAGSRSTSSEGIGGSRRASMTSPAPSNARE